MRSQAGGRPSLRPTIWKILLRIPELSSAQYLSFVAKGDSPVHEKSEWKQQQQKGGNTTRLAGETPTRSDRALSPVCLQSRMTHSGH